MTVLSRALQLPCTSISVCRCISSICKDELCCGVGGILLLKGGSAFLLVTLHISSLPAKSSNPSSVLWRRKRSAVPQIPNQTQRKHDHRTQSPPKKGEQAHLAMLFGAHLHGLATILQFCHHNTSPCLSTLHTKSWSPMYLFLHVPRFFDNKFGPLRFPGIFIYLLLIPHLMHRYFVASTQHSVRCFVSSLFFSTKIHLSFGYGLNSSQSFHSSTRQ